jgi:hypothetical protein
LRMEERCTRAYRFGGRIPAFPAQWLYGLLRALPGERLFCLRCQRDTSRQRNASTATSEPHDFTVRIRRAVTRAISVHRISPHVRDDREAPLIRRETGGVMPMIWVRTKAEYFRIAGLTRFLKIRSDLCSLHERSDMQEHTGHRCVMQTTLAIALLHELPSSRLDARTNARAAASQHERPRAQPPATPGKPSQPPAL